MPSTKADTHSTFTNLLSSAIFNPSVDQLIEACILEDECRMSSTGAVVAYSGKYTGRTPKDKYVCADPAVADGVWWENNNRMDPSAFSALRADLIGRASQGRLYVVDTYAGADPEYRIAVRFIVQRPYHALFIKALIRPNDRELQDFQPDWTVLNLGQHKMTPGEFGLQGDACIAMSFANREVLIAGTQYAGEMKKSIFTVMNFLLPARGVLSMHCSANIGETGDVALFFGLSGTGKTTLSTDPHRKLIGDDEHGWSDQGVFNVEGGCYAKCIHLRQDREAEIWAAIRRGAVLENVVLDAEGVPNYSDSSLTENTRAAYPLEYIENSAQPSVGGHPSNIVFLTCDAMGVLPPISRLSPEQAMEHFLCGYTAKVAGTEKGVTEPTTTFSTCFGAPFLPRPPKVYASLLRENILQHNVKVWLVNTGWTGGGFGVGQRMDLAYTRAMVRAALDGVLAEVEYSQEPIFGLSVPLECPGVPAGILLPRQTWNDAAEYDRKAAALRTKFEETLRKFD